MNHKTLQRYISHLRDGKPAPQLGAFGAGTLTRFNEKPDAPYVVKWFGAEDKAAKCLFVEIVICKLERGLTLEQALQTTRMVDADVEFVKLTREKLLFENEYLRPVIGKVVVCRDPREYDDSFNGTDKTNAELHNHSEAEVAATKRYGLRW